MKDKRMENIRGEVKSFRRKANIFFSYPIAIGYLLCSSLNGTYLDTSPSIYPQFFTQNIHLLNH